MRVNAIRRVNLAGILSEPLGRQMQDRVGQRGIVLLALVFEVPHVISEDDVGRRNLRKALLEVLAMSLHRGPERPQVHTIGPDADRSTPPARAKGENLVKAIEQPPPLLFLDQ